VNATIDPSAAERTFLACLPFFIVPLVDSTNLIVHCSNDSVAWRIAGVGAGADSLEELSREGVAARAWGPSRMSNAFVSNKIRLGCVRISKVNNGATRWAAKQQARAAIAQIYMEI
jgi:hypothetical protein